jgi:2-keto-3-deoxy-L-rhamnonate aldolase RhmA/pimeloyl-ACP methyl ester carboxylesterase
VTLAARLAGGEALTGLIAKMPCAAQVESAGHVGFDFVVLDTEHGPGGGFALEEHLRASAIPALVRVPGPDAILAALDAGATGVVVPHVLHAAGAEAVVAAAHYPPSGRRGIALSTRAGRYGAVSLDDHLRRAAEETCVIVQIEDREALEHADAILAVPGVSGVLIGSADLALSLGRPPRAELDAAIDRVIAAAGRAGVAAMTVVTTAAERRSPIVLFVATTLIHAAFAGAVAVAGARAPSGPETLVLLPGMLGEAALWDAVAPSLAEHAALRFSRIDLDDTIEDMAAGVLASAPERFALAGHSLGAIVALDVVRQAPERVTRLALLNASARPANDAQLETWAAMRDGEFAAVAQQFALANGGPPETVEAMAHAVGPRGLRRQLAAQAARPDSRPSLPSIGVPTLVLTGAEDRICPRELQEELAAGIPGARHTVIEDAGHMLPLDAPTAVAAALQTWMKGTP